MKDERPISADCVETADIAHLNTVGERNQGFVDGGMFAMTLALGFHARAMGTCMLNWSVTRDRDRAMRAYVGIPESKLVVTMIGAGLLKANFKVPHSQRKRISEVLKLNAPVAANELRDDRSAPGPRWPERYASAVRCRRLPL